MPRMIMFVPLLLALMILATFGETRTCFFAIRDTELASLGLRASGSSRTAALASSA